MRKVNDLAASGIPALVVGVVAFLIAVIIGLMIWYKTNTAVYTIFKFPYDGTAHLAANNTYAAINTSANSTWTLAPIVGLVLIAGVIIATIMMFAGGKRM